MRAEKQGSQFEKTLLELLSRLIGTDLGLDLTTAVEQRPGAQYGKDLLLGWRDAQRRSVTWHVECKSHVTGSLPAREVGDKLLDVHRSAHAIDVWCLALAEIEPSPGLEETLQWANRNLDLGFSLEVLSPGRDDIKRLFAFHPDLYEKQYGAAAMPTIDRDEVLEGFRRFLIEATERGRRSRTAKNPWTLVAPERIDVRPDAPERAIDYLRGLVSAPDWAVVAHGWAVDRRSATEPLLERIRGTGVGLDFAWLLGAAGEGKSTVMRQVAWELASDDDWVVLWTDRRTGEGPCALPVDLLSAFSPETGVLLCIDESESVTRSAQLRAFAEQLAEDGVRVFVLVADRGVRWRRTELRGDLLRGLSPGTRDISLGRLSGSELAQLVGVLQERDLLYSNTEEAERLVVDAQASAGNSSAWLLPTLMQLTDPQGRGFETILENVLESLQDDVDALRLLLAGALAQAAGDALPEDLARRLVPAGKSYPQTLALLKEELERQLVGSSRTASAETTGYRLHTHHAVLADGFVGVADTPRWQAYLLDVCRALPETITEEVTDVHIVPPRRFRFLQCCVAYLLSESDPPRFALASEFFESWCALHDSQWPTQHRHAECLMAWLIHEQQNGADRLLVNALRDQAAGRYRLAYETVRRVTADDVLVPSPLRKYDPALSESIIFHAWAVLESTYGQSVGDRESFQRAAFLSLISLRPGADNMGYSLSTLGWALFHLDALTDAARVTSALLDVAPGDGGAARLKEELQKRRGEPLPEGGRRALAKALGAISTGLLIDSERIGVFATREEHLVELLTVLSEVQDWIGTSDHLGRAIRTLTEIE